MSQQQIDAQAVIAELRNQRNDALDQLAMANALIAKLRNDQENKADGGDE